MTTEVKISAVEKAKLASNHLRGTIAQTLADPALDHFEEDDKQLLKFHGTYQQYDRDVKKQPGVKGPPPKVWSFMVRLNIPAGIMSAKQWLDLQQVADSFSSGILRLTTRQTIQYHGIVKGNMKPFMQGIHDTLLSSIAACGDVQRNVMASPAPIKDKAHETIHALAVDITERLKPQTKAYFEIWIDGELHSSSDDATNAKAEEPFYGDRYLPRKFKTGVALDTDNSVDLYAYDCGLIGITEPDPDGPEGARRIVGFNVVAGGGFGMTHNKAETIARVATPVAFVKPENATDAVESVARVFRDNGNRENRKQARLKYLIEKWGVEKFAEEFAKDMKASFDAEVESSRPLPSAIDQPDYLGQHDQLDGRFFYGVFIRNGRVKDVEDGPQYKAACAQIAQEIGCEFRITPMQSLLFCDLDQSQVDRIREILREHSVPIEDEVSKVLRYSMACVALPTCGLALTDSERAMPLITDQLTDAMESRGLGDVDITVRMTGCPNGCARPYNADIGFVGRKPGRYHIFVGGGLRSNRISDLFAADVAFEELVPALEPLLDKFAAERTDNEGVGDFYQRLRGHPEAGDRVYVTGKEDPTAELVQLSVSS